MKTMRGAHYRSWWLLRGCSNGGKQQLEVAKQTNRIQGDQQYIEVFKGKTMPSDKFMNNRLLSYLYTPENTCEHKENNKLIKRNK